MKIQLAITQQKTGKKLIITTVMRSIPHKAVIFPHKAQRIISKVQNNQGFLLTLRDVMTNLFGVLIIHSVIHFIKISAFEIDFTLLFFDLNGETKSTKANTGNLNAFTNTIKITLVIANEA